MRKMLLVFLLVLSFAFTLTACGGGESESDGAAADNSIGDVANGERLFAQTTIGTANSPGCITCHSLEPGVVLVGPPQHDVGLRAATRVEGLSAEDYLRQSIVEPNAYIVEGYDAGLMHMTYGEELPDAVINDLVAYLLTLQGE